MERVNWQQAVRPSTHDLIAAINSGADDIERIDGALVDIETVLDGKAGVSGTYPDFVAGEALSIRSGIRSNTFLSRALDTDVADGIAEISRVLGNTVVWNQLCNTSTGVTDSNNGITTTVNSDGSVSLSGTSTEIASINLGYSFDQIAGHKYLFKGCPKNEGTINYWLGFAGLRSDTGDGGIYTNTEAHNYRVRFQCLADVNVDGMKLYPMCIDLTTMFGAGNEPQTVAEFEAMYGSDYYPYSAPALLSSHIAGIQSASACEFPTQTLRGIGTARDAMTRVGIERVITEITLTDNEDFRIIGTDTTTGNIQFCLFLDSSKPIAANARSLVRTPKFTYNAQWYGTPDATTYTISLNPSTRQILFTVPSTVSTVAAMQALMAGEHLAYKVLTPTTETFAEPLDLTYSVEADGSEAWIVPDGTAPTSAAVTGEIGYPLDPARALITHESFADFIDKLGAYIGATITETWDGSKYTYAFASGRSALLGSIESEPDALEVTEKDDIVKEIIEDERKEQ